MNVYVLWILLVAVTTPQGVGVVDQYGNKAKNVSEINAVVSKEVKNFCVFDSTGAAKAFVAGMPINVKSAKIIIDNP